jgi:hypothetical protein
MAEAAWGVTHAACGQGAMLGPQVKLWVHE